MKLQRTRKEIEGNLKFVGEFSDEVYKELDKIMVDKISIEILLDIRDLLQERDKPTEENRYRCKAHKLENCDDCRGYSDGSFERIEEPKEWKDGDEYWYISSLGTVLDRGRWGGYSTDERIRDFLGIFRTEKEAKARLEEIKRLIK